MHPILFQIGNFTIGTYGVMIVVGMLAALGLMARLARRRGLKHEFFYDLTFVLLISGFLGARILFILLGWNDFLADPLGMIFARGGFVFLGGFGAALVAGIWFTLRHKMPLLEVIDIVAPGLVLAHAFGRIGCFFAGCCYGFACPDDHAHGALAHKLAVQYPAVMEHGKLSETFNFALGGQIHERLLPPTATVPLPILPVQLFESFGNFLICAFLFWQWRRRRFSGQTFALYLVLYSILRFGLEFLRGDIDRGVFLGGALSTSQIITIFTFLGGLWLWWSRRDKGFESIQPEAREESTPVALGGAELATAPEKNTRRRR